MTMTLFHSLWTIVVLATFIGIIFWAYSSNRKASFDEAAKLPLEDDSTEPSKNNNSEQTHG